MNANRVEQVFLERRSGRVEALLVLEDEAGARVRERILLPTGVYGDAATQLGRQLANRGVERAGKVRLRISQGGKLLDDSELLRRFLAALAA